MSTTLTRETLTEATARRLRGLLAEHRISGSAVARAIGYPQSAISRRMLGKTDMSIPEIEAICATTGFSAQYLVFGQGESINDFEQLQKMQRGEVPPAGFEPAAFCSEGTRILPRTSGFVNDVRFGAFAPAAIAGLLLDQNVLNLTRHAAVSTATRLTPGVAATNAIAKVSCVRQTSTRHTFRHADGQTGRSLMVGALHRRQRRHVVCLPDDGEF